jgi:hypothetical protein
MWKAEKSIGGVATRFLESLGHDLVVDLGSVQSSTTAARKMTAFCVGTKLASFPYGRWSTDWVSDTSRL